MKNQSFAFEFGHEKQNHDQFTIALKTIIPQIERQLIGDIERQLKDQFDEKYSRAVQSINQKALSQYQNATKQLQQSRQLLLKQKQFQILKQISVLQQNLVSVQQEKFIKLQQKFLQQNFDSRIMTHPSILGFQKQMQQQIFSLLQQKHQATKQRQIKELIIGNQTKQIRLRKDLDLQIKSRIFSSSGLQELRQEIKLSKTQIGSQKSQFNLKLKRIQTQIKEFNQKIKQIQKMGDLQRLRQQYQDLRIQLIQQGDKVQLNQHQAFENNQKQLKFSLQNRQSNEAYIQNSDDSLDEDESEQVPRNTAQAQNIHKMNQKVLKRQKQNIFVPEANFINKQIDLNNQDYEQDSNNLKLIQSRNNSKKFNLTAYFKDYLLNSHTAKITESQNIQMVDSERVESKKASLLDLQNVCELLKQKIGTDPLQRYLNKQSIHKQNNMNGQNQSNQQKASNFAQIYQKHLKQLNKGSVKKRTTQKNQSSARKSAGLSSWARKTITKNLAHYHRENFYQKNQNTQNIANQTPTCWALISEIRRIEDLEPLADISWKQHLLQAGYSIRFTWRFKHLN